MRIQTKKKRPLHYAPVERTHPAQSARKPDLPRNNLHLNAPAFQLDPNRQARMQVAERAQRHKPHTFAAVPVQVDTMPRIQPTAAIGPPSGLVRRSSAFALVGASFIMSL